MVAYSEVPVETISEEIPFNAFGEVPHPLLLGNSSIIPVPHKSAGSLNVVGVTPSASVGCPVPLLSPVQLETRSYQQDPYCISATYPIDTIVPPQRYPEIPGVGAISKPSICGSYKTSFACTKDHTHFMQKVPHKCFKTSCPVCFSASLTRASSRIARVFRGYRARVDSLDLSVDSNIAAHHRAMARHLNHFVLSVPVSKYAEGTDERKIIAAARRVAARAGIEMGMMAVHPWRINEKIKSRLVRKCKKPDLMSDEIKEKKFWALIREDALELGSWRNYVHWSPHVHALGYGYLPSQETPEEKTAFKKLTKGWFVKKIKRGRNYDIEQIALADCFNGLDVEDPIAAVAYYILSHAAYRPGRNLYTFFGLFNPSKLRKNGKPENNKVQAVCPKCNSPLAFGEDVAGVFQYAPGVRGDKWRPRLLNLQHQPMLIMGIDPPPEKVDKAWSRVWSP